VTCPTTERFADKFRQAGAEPILFSAPEIKNAPKILQYPAPDDPKFWHVYASVFCPPLLLTAASTLADVEDFYRENVPDVVVYEWFAFAGRILAARLNRPAIQLWAHFAHHDNVVRIDGVCSNPEPLMGFAHLLDSFMAAHGLPGKNHLWHREKTNIYFIPREFQFDHESFDERFRFVGPSIGRPPRSAWRNPSQGKKIVLVSESAVTRDSRFFKTCIEALADADYHVVYSVGDNSPQAKATTLPRNFSINKDAYNLEILPHASLIVCQGGTGTVMEALYHGVPVLAVPPTPFHCEVTDRVEELQLGLQIPDNQFSPASVRAGVDRILNDAALLQAVQAAQRKFKSAGGSQAAADAIESVLNG